MFRAYMLVLRFLKAKDTRITEGEDGLLGDGVFRRKAVRNGVREPAWPTG